MFTAKIRFVSGIGGDRVEVQIFEDGKEVDGGIYSYGYNASHNRTFEKMAQIDYENSIKYNWGHDYQLRPYIGDILVELLGKYGLTKEEAEYSGYYVFPQREANEEEVADIIKDYYKEL